ncbi:DUF6600 domain-containing protein [Pendulispora albinea]|uniref:Uncharacterized protein n=1 Tax=Pendulispora albinea TaxID=2741071 RepID=A0ABZ2M5C9_9BACT
MKVGWFRIASGSIAPLALLLVGCAERYEEAEYPRQPAQAATEPIHTSSTGATLEGTAPGKRDPNEIAIGVDERAYADTDPTALTEFRATLEPYGTWSDDPSYGTVWVPSIATVGPDFAPYVSAGHWVYDDDWIWVSDYSWGWAPFHYGRWVNIPGRGWAWIPGRTYRGAWVTWRVGYGPYDYVGWSAMPPTWYWRGGYAVGFYVAPPPTYYYCPHRDIFSPAVGTRIVPPARIPAIAAATKPYMPADPAVANGRVVTVPGASADASGRTPAQPGVGGMGRSGGYGPPPSALGIPESAVVHPGSRDSGLDRARAMAVPSTAVAVGARPPQGFAHVEGPSGAGRVVTGPQLLPSMPDGRGARMGPNGPVASGPIRLPDHGGGPIYVGPHGRAIPPSPGSPPYIGPNAYALPPSAGSHYVPPRSPYALPPFPSSGPTFPSSAIRPGVVISNPYQAPTYVPPAPPVFHTPPSMPMFQGGGGMHMGGSPSVGAGPGQVITRP